MKKFFAYLFLQTALAMPGFAAGSFSLTSADAVPYTDSYIKSTDGALSVYLVNALESDASLEFVSGQDSLYECKWFSYDESAENLTELTANVSVKAGSSKLMNPALDKGYAIQYTKPEGGEEMYYVWLTKFLPISSAKWLTDQYYCSYLPIKISPVMTYIPLSGYATTIKREEELTYNVFEFQSGKRIENKTELVVADSMFYVADVPTMNTSFKLTNADFNTVFVTDTFQSYVVNAFPKIVTDEKALNEIDEKNLEKDENGNAVLYFNSGSSFRSSAPLTLQITSNMSPTVTEFQWHFAADSSFRGAKIYSQKSLQNIYNFNELNSTGKHWIKLVVKNSKSECDHSSVAHFEIKGSELYVPNTFTPNGDGTNDKFMVSYKSITEFDCRIYNQWGRKVYESTDITEGWDGTYKDDELPTGAYFCVIKAKGADGKEFNEKQTINLVRSSK